MKVTSLKLLQPQKQLTLNALHTIPPKPFSQCIKFPLEISPELPPRITVSEFPQLVQSLNCPLEHCINFPLGTVPKISFVCSWLPLWGVQCMNTTFIFYVPELPPWSSAWTPSLYVPELPPWYSAWTPLYMFLTSPLVQWLNFLCLCSWTPPWYSAWTPSVYVPELPT